MLADIVETNETHNPNAVAIDRGFQGNWIAGKLVEIYGKERVREFAQGLLSMSAPFREMLELIKAGRFFHPNHPVLNWMAGNCAASGRGGLSKPCKDSSPEKIDGITAIVMAAELTVTMPADPSPTLNFI